MSDLNESTVTLTFEELGQMLSAAALIAKSCSATWGDHTEVGIASRVMSDFDIWGRL